MNKKKHYFDKYLKVGETSRLDLVFGKLPLTRKSVLSHGYLHEGATNNFIKKETKSPDFESILRSNETHAETTSNIVNAKTETRSNIIEVNALDLT